jgi:hypothetical protein
LSLHFMSKGMSAFMACKSTVAQISHQKDPSSAEGDEDTLHFYRLSGLDSSAVWSNGVAGSQCQQRRGRQGPGGEHEPSWRSCLDLVGDGHIVVVRHLQVTGNLLCKRACKTEASAKALENEQGQGRLRLNSSCSGGSISTDMMTSGLSKGGRGRRGGSGRAVAWPGAGAIGFGDGDAIKPGGRNGG